MAARTRYRPTEAERHRISMLWAAGRNSAEIGIDVCLAESIVCSVLSEQQDRRLFSRKMGVVA
jgi:hypothetical protein